MYQEKCPYYTSVDIGLPRTLPWLRQIHFKKLTLDGFHPHSSEALLRCFPYHLTENIELKGLRWPEGIESIDSASTISRKLLRQLSSRVPKKIWVGTRILPLVRTLYTTDSDRPSPAMKTRLLYIKNSQISTVMSLIRLVHDECKCPLCAGRVFTGPGDHVFRRLWLHPGVYHT